MRLDGVEAMMELVEVHRAQDGIVMRCVTVARRPIMQSLQTDDVVDVHVCVDFADLVPSLVCGTGSSELGVWETQYSCWDS
jgi:hypothetical protein